MSVTRQDKMRKRSRGTTLIELIMAMAILAMSADAPVRLDDVACVNKSYPEFWDDLRKVGGHAE